MDLRSQNENLVPTLNGEGFTLRPMVVSDVAAAVAALSQWSVTKWLTSVPFPFRAEHAEEFITEIAPVSDGPIWAIDKSGKMIGVIGADPNLGYWLHPDYHGRGIMTCAAKLVLNQVFTHGRKEIGSGYVLGNAASCAVLTKLGFKASHIQDELQVATGEMVTLQRVTLLGRDWEARDD